MAKYHFGVQCLDCKDRLFSFWVHDFKHCGCGKVYVDGGTDYLRYGWTSTRPKRIRFTEKRDGKYPKRRKGEVRSAPWPY